LTAIIDTGFLLAVVSVADRAHDACSLVLENEERPLLPSVILTELAYMISRDIGRPHFIRLMRSIVAGELELVFLTTEDLARATDIMEQYADSRLDFVDCAITAMAERLNISRILTVDQRDFRMIRPSHIPAFEILP